MYSRVLVVVAALVLGSVGSASAQTPMPAASSNIRAAFTVTRILPVAEAIVTFNHIEHIDLAVAARVPRGQMLADALKAAGLTVTTWTSTTNANANIQGGNNNGVNQIGDPQAGTVDTVQLYSFTVNGFKRLDDVRVAFAKNGVRQLNGISVRTTDADKIFDEMAAEAAQAATARARKIAVALGVANAEIADVTFNPVNPVNPQFQMQGGMFPMQSALTHTTGIEQGVTVSVTANVLLAAPRGAK